MCTRPTVCANCSANASRKLHLFRFAQTSWSNAFAKTTLTAVTPRFAGNFWKRFGSATIWQTEQCVIANRQSDTIVDALNGFHIELPSWGFANTGTRFGKFNQPAAATCTEEKFRDAGQVHRWTGVCPTIALHVLWDLPKGAADVLPVQALAAQHGLRAGSINPNVFEDQCYKYGSFGNPDPEIRKAAVDHVLGSVEIAKGLGSRDLSLWFDDGSNYPGTQNMRHRRRWFGGSEKHSSATQRRSAHVGGIQTLRAGLLPHRYRRLGHGAAVRQSRRPARQGAGGYGPSLPGAEHRADCGLAAGS